MMSVEAHLARVDAQLAAARLARRQIRAVRPWLQADMKPWSRALDEGDLRDLSAGERQLLTLILTLGAPIVSELERALEDLGASRPLHAEAQMRGARHPLRRSPQRRARQPPAPAPIRFRHRRRGRGGAPRMTVSVPPSGFLRFLPADGHLAGRVIASGPFSIPSPFRGQAAGARERLTDQRGGMRPGTGPAPAGYGHTVKCRPLPHQHPSQQELQLDRPRQRANADAALQPSVVVVHLHSSEPVLSCLSMKGQNAWRFLAQKRPEIFRVNTP